MSSQYYSDGIFYAAEEISSNGLKLSREEVMLHGFIFESDLRSWRSPPEHGHLPAIA